MLFLFIEKSFIPDTSVRNSFSRSLKALGDSDLTDLTTLEDESILIAISSLLCKETKVPIQHSVRRKFFDYGRFESNEVIA